jgi:hypothetical protein
LRAGRFLWSAKHWRGLNGAKAGFGAVVQFVRSTNLIAEHTATTWAWLQISGVTRGLSGYTSVVVA